MRHTILETKEIENEVILLRNIYDHIDEMINFSLFEIQGTYTQCNVMFHDSNNSKLFFILLVDFLSKTDKKGPIKNTTFLNGLVTISEAPKFSVNNSESNLKVVVAAFREWLNEKKNIDVWMPSINREELFSISRLDMIKLCGNISKHNYLRAIGVAQDLQKIIKNSGFEINEEQALLVLPDFYERFQDDILIYLSSHICEFLNNIRLAIRSYLQPQFDGSYHKFKDKLSGYNYHVADAIRSDYARDCYWELMNKLRRKPCMEKFCVSNNFKEIIY